VPDGGVELVATGRRLFPVNTGIDTRLIHNSCVIFAAEREIRMPVDAGRSQAVAATVGYWGRFSRKQEAFHLLRKRAEAMMTFQSIPFDMKKLSLLLSGYALAVIPPAVTAADWIIAPAVTVEQIYTDNVHLSSADAQGESITQLKPSISIYRTGARANVDINYAPEYNRYWQGTQDNELVHYLRADGQVEMMQDHLFLDGWGSANMTNLSSTGRTGIDALTARADTTEVYTAGVSPYFKTRMGNFASLEARYTADAVNYTAHTVDDNKGQRADLVLGSGSAFNNQVWELSATKSIVSYDSLADDNEVRLFRAEFIQQLTHQWAVSFAAGHEEYNLAVTTDSSGALWSVGMIYTPSPRTRLAVGGGERAFGNDYHLDFSHRSPHTVWTANYRRDYASARDEVVRPTLFERQDAFGNLVRDPVLENPIAAESTSSPTLSPDYFEIEEFTTDFNLETGRTKFNLRGSHTKRLYEISVNDTRDLYFRAGASRDLSRQLSTSLRLGWYDHKEEILNYKQWLASLGVGYRLGNRTRLGATVTHLKRNAESDAASYKENRFSIYLTSTF
jgi:uncharacterized protein (PEP-CTERM system associated)